MIDEMMVVLRQEEADDIAHKDRCENADNANANELDDLEAAIEKTEDKIKSTKETKTAVEGELQTTEDNMGKTQGEIDELTKFRTTESDDFKKESSKQLK